MNTSSGRSSRGCLYGFWIGVAVVLGVVGCGLHAAREALQAERNLHSTLYVIRLVNQFVQEKGRWPDSWEELEAMPFGGEAARTGAPGSNVVRVGGAMSFSWPREAAELRERVAIDFRVDESEVVNREVEEFQPIRPVGPYFNYWKYGFIEELQDSLRKSLEVSK